MAYRIIYRPEATAELDQLLTHISQAAGWPVANAFVGGIIEFIEGLRTFPKRGTERTEILPGLRIIGYKRRASIAFVVLDTEVIVLGVFYGGRNITTALLEERL
jgi:toxin ParE1/3/4